MNDGSQWFYGLFLHTPLRGNVEALEDTLIHVDSHGRIASVISRESPEFTRDLQNADASGCLTRLGQDQLFIPGLVDLHVHAPQWPQLGKALHLPLQDWLQKHTFPLESRYHDIDFAERVYASLVRALLANGTTTAMYFATVHEEATEKLAAICLDLGQRAFVGRVAMDNAEQCPDYYRDADAAAALEASRRNLQAIRQLPGNRQALVKPVITPRFIPSCTNELLQGLGELAAQYRCHVQTHCSESDWEHHYVLDRLLKTDTQALSDFGLLTRHTVLAHSNFITDADMQLIHEKGAGIAHCPLSNSYFADSVFPLRQALDKSLRVGLGTDIAGGHSASVFSACQHAVSSSRMLESGVDTTTAVSLRENPGARINFLEAFYLATMGGADVLDTPVGAFEVGRQFDAVVLQLDHPLNRLNEFTAADNWEELLGCVVYNTQVCNIATVWVNGSCVHTAMHQSQ